MKCTRGPNPGRLLRTPALSYRGTYLRDFLDIPVHGAALLLQRFLPHPGLVVLMFGKVDENLGVSRG